MIGIEADEELIQLVERRLADAEEAYRLDPSDANQRRIMKAWSAVAEHGKSQNPAAMNRLRQCPTSRPPRSRFGRIPTALDVVVKTGSLRSTTGPAPERRIAVWWTAEGVRA